MEGGSWQNSVGKMWSVKARHCQRLHQGCVLQSAILKIQCRVKGREGQNGQVRLPEPIQIIQQNTAGLLLGNVAVCLAYATFALCNPAPRPKQTPPDICAAQFWSGDRQPNSTSYHLILAGEFRRQLTLTKNPSEPVTVTNATNLNIDSVPSIYQVDA